MKESGAEISEVDFTPFYDVAGMLYDGAWVAERYTVVEALMRNAPETIHPVTRQIVEKAETQSAADAFRDFYRLQELKRLAEPHLETIDCLCVPTIPTFYSTADLEADPITPNANLGTYTNFVNLLDLCGIAVPTEPRGDGRPGSVTLLARSGKDALTASVASIFEKNTARHLGATQHPVPEPRPATPRCSDSEMEIAVCGAHMTGLPLNGQLTERSGRFLRHAETAPSYRFYELAGGPPKRPGLVRVNGQEGHSVKLEIWSLPLDQVGGFLAGIPTPLGIGSVELTDGTWVKGFICEAAGAEDGSDISELGDWRAHIAQCV